ncbi:hypothetical protein C8Q74DRAFT_341199 [Fomes fomentarius]|nr:hypothetical protein C8Q74DRAFT_341199 [Fomes fomentarius]
MTFIAAKLFFASSMVLTQLGFSRRTLNTTGAQRIRSLRLAKQVSSMMSEVSQHLRGLRIWDFAHISPIPITRLKHGRATVAILIRLRKYEAWSCSTKRSISRIECCILTRINLDSSLGSRTRLVGRRLGDSHPRSRSMSFAPAARQWPKRSSRPQA